MSRVSSAAELATATLIEDADYWRGLPVAGKLTDRYKEWNHFVVFGENWLIVFNLSLEGSGLGRVITMLSDGNWNGQISQCTQVKLRSGRLDATFGRAGMRWSGGCYEIWQHAEGVQLEIILEPVSIPSVSHNIGLGADAHLSWCLVPRLLASGWLESGGRRIQFKHRLAYHDHNWGRFGWGGDFSWEWGCAVPDDPAVPWTVVFARMNDRARLRTTATSVFLLKGGKHVRYFRNAEAHFETEGILEACPALRIPAAAAILQPNQDRDVPRWVRFDAQREGEGIRGHIEARSRAQVLMPSETSLRKVSRLNEVHACAQMDGWCDGERVHLIGPSLLEVVHG